MPGLLDSIIRAGQAGQSAQINRANLAQAEQMNPLLLAAKQQSLQQAQDLAPLKRQAAQLELDTAQSAQTQQQKQFGIEDQIGISEYAKAWLSAPESVRPSLVKAAQQQYGLPAEDPSLFTEDMAQQLIAAGEAARNTRPAQKGASEVKNIEWVPSETVPGAFDRVGIQTDESGQGRRVTLEVGQTHPAFSLESEKQRAKTIETFVGDVATQAEKSDAINSTLGQLTALRNSENLINGPLWEIEAFGSALAQRFGIDFNTEELGATEAYDAMIKELAQKSIPKGQGSVSNYEQKLNIAKWPDLARSIKGMELITVMQGAIADRSLDYNEFVQNATSGATPRNIRKMASSWLKRNPIEEYLPDDLSGQIDAAVKIGDAPRSKAAQGGGILDGMPESEIEALKSQLTPEDIQRLSTSDRQRLGL